MPTMVGPRVGGAIGARIEMDYDIQYAPNHDGWRLELNLYLATDHALRDSVNSWATWGQIGDAGGNNLNIQHGGAGRTHLRGYAEWRGAGIVGVGARVSSLEAVGTVEAVFYIDPGGLAPTTDGNYYAYNIGSQAFVVGNIIANGNGGTLTDVSVQVNTTASESGAAQYQRGAFADITIPGLYRATLYYFRLRVANNTYGWGPWGPWRTATTAPEPPWTPIGYSATNVTQVSAVTTGINVPNDGGRTLSNVRAELRKDGSTSVTTITQGSWGDITFNGLDPGTQYSFRIAAGNSAGWSAYGGWASFTTLPGVMIKLSGVWRNAIPYVKQGGVWKQATRYVKWGGVWR